MQYFSTRVSNKHTSVSFSSSTTLLTFVKESCTWLDLWLRCSVTKIDLTSALPTPLSDVWGITGLVVPTRSSSCYNRLLNSVTQSTCSLKTASSDSKAAVFSAAMKFRTSTWRSSNSQSYSLASYFSKGVNSSFSSSLPMSFSIWVRQDRASAPFRTGYHIRHSIWLVQSINQSKPRLKLPIWIEGAMFAPGLLLSEIPNCKWCRFLLCISHNQFLN